MNCCKEKYKYDVRDHVKDYYGKRLASSGDLITNVCKLGIKFNKDIIDTLKLIPDDVKNRFYGCGSPFVDNVKGLTVLDLGSGSGRDCYVMANLVGKDGHVIGVDMTDALLEIANNNIKEYEKNLGWKPNLEFKKGYIENLNDIGIDNNSIDLCISNCVINLTSNKKNVLSQVYNVLKTNGRFVFSDTYANKELPEYIKIDPKLVGERLGGSMSIIEFENLANEIGFKNIEKININHININDDFLDKKFNNDDIKFFSITYKLNK